jgi:prolyl oligopeptidase
VPELVSTPPVSAVDPVTEILHGVPVTDPYRWLEDQNSPPTREWICEQTRYARSYLDHVPGRERIRERVREFLDVEAYDSLQNAGQRYFFRKRLRGQEQPCIYMRDGAEGPDELLIDPSTRGTGSYTAVRPLRVSPDGRLLLYEVKQGGERTGTFEILDVERRQALPEILPRGYLRGFAFAEDGKSFCYVHEPLHSISPPRRAAFRHLLGSDFREDQQIFFAGEDEKIRLYLLAGQHRLGFLVYKFLEKTLVSLYVQSPPCEESYPCLVADGCFRLGPTFAHGKVLAITDRDAPNLRIVEIRERDGHEAEWSDTVPQSDLRIHQWKIVGRQIVVSYVQSDTTRVCVFELDGNKTNEWPARTEGRAVRFLASSEDRDELIVETESFTQPPAILRCAMRSSRFDLWSQAAIPFDPGPFRYVQASYRSKDGTAIPIFLVGRREVLRGGCHPAIMTSYGGYGMSMTPQFSVFVAFLMERGCLFALPRIRGGSEFGARWHEAAKRRNRQTAYDDFLAAAEWLIATGRTSSDRLAIFGGSNSGLLVGAALTQRPELFRAAVCMVPLLDMLRYHLFDNAHVWRDEFGTAEDPDDFAALVRYSPYHNVREGCAYPATLIVSGDADQTCNPLHARKMAARLQAASASGQPILLDYSPARGHSPVLPLGDRVEALTDRMAFLCDQLRLTA